MDGKLLKPVVAILSAAPRSAAQVVWRFSRRPADPAVAWHARRLDADGPNRPSSGTPDADEVIE